MQKIQHRDFATVLSGVVKALNVRDSLSEACRRQVISMLVMLCVQSPAGLCAILRAGELGEAE